MDPTPSTSHSSPVVSSAPLTPPPTSAPLPPTTPSTNPQLLAPLIPPHLTVPSTPKAATPARALKALESIRAFLESKSCYDILPESFRLIVFDNKLGITKSLAALVTNGVVSAPLYDSTTQRFSGMFTLADVVHLIQYYYLTQNEYDNVIAEVEGFQLESLRRIEQAIDVPPPPTISVHPDAPLSEACAALVRSHARRLPLVDRDDQTGKETIVSVLTQYRVLKFIAINCQHDCARLDQSIGSLGIGSYVSWWEPAESSEDPSTFTQSPTEATGASSLDQDIARLSTKPDLDRADLTLNINAAANLSDGDTAEPYTPTTERGGTPRPDTPKASGLNSIPPVSAPPAATPDKPAKGDDEAETPVGPQFGVQNRFFPLSTATLETSVFDVVHVFSERGISAVPIVDADGVVLNMYETVDIVDLVRQKGYDILHSTIAVALSQRAPDFGGVITCSPKDTLASILAYIRERRVHRIVIVEDEDVPADGNRAARKKGALVGILSLSDVLRFLVGHENLKGLEVPGLGVHGLRGVTNDSLQPGTDIDAISLADTDPAGSKMGSRRGSEASVMSDAGVVRERERSAGGASVVQPPGVETLEEGVQA